jgi:hypothetical protein
VMVSSYTVPLLPYFFLSTILVGIRDQTVFHAEMNVSTPPFIPSGLIIKDVITFIAVVSDEFHQQVFNFSHRPPYALRIDVSPVSNRPALVAFMDQIVHEHHRELLAAYPWKCGECGLPATTLYHHPTSMLHHDDDPRIRNFSRPICFEGTPCWHGYQRRISYANEMATRQFEDVDVQSFCSSSIRCGYCAKADVIDGDTLKRCGKCKAIRYCSRECQAADWPNHKKVCRHCILVLP